MNNMLKEELQKLLPRYGIIQAFDGFETGRQLTEEKAGFLLLDSTLPGVDIDKLIRTVKTDPAFGKPFVFVMAAPGAVVPEDADGVFSRPPDVSKLAETVKSLEKQIESAVTA
jgi:DNA-binding response OmpR family regulator